MYCGSLSSVVLSIVQRLTGRPLQDRFTFGYRSINLNVLSCVLYAHDIDTVGVSKICTNDLNVRSIRHTYFWLFEPVDIFVADFITKNYQKYGKLKCH